MPRAEGRSRLWRDHRQAVEGIVFRCRTGVAWRDLPERFGRWQTVWKRHHRFVGFEDPQWPRNGTALVAPGPLVGGGYHFARPDLGNQPEAEAEWFWNRVIARCGTAKGLLLALDLEAGCGRPLRT